MILNNCRLIGLTGGIATGKSTVSNMLLKKGYKVIDADMISRQVVEVGKPAYYDIVDTFGLKILLEDKTINRKKLSRIIFDNPVIRDTLNKIVHPRVFTQIVVEVDESCRDNRIIFVDIPLLFEAMDQILLYDLKFEEIWLVYTDLETQLSRLMARDKIDKREAMSKINSQISIEEKKSKSTITLYNNGDLIDLEKNLDLMLEKLKQ